MATTTEISPQTDKKILIAMSGGVDSSAAALIIREAGHEALGVTMCFGLSFADGNPKSCCDPRSISDARRVCQKIGIPHYTLDHADQLKSAVIDDFIAEYKRGRTPNPCVRCNQRLKFTDLLEKAKELDCDAIATGHYAKIVEDEEGFHLEAAEDKRKDQTYFLWGIKKADLAHILFPVSHLQKPALRKIAEDAGLPTANKQESQDICFVTDGNYRNLLRSYGVESKSGDMVTTTGKVVSQHTGISDYTVGQRKGLGVALGAPKYVVEVDVVNNRVVIGDRTDLDAMGCIITEYNAFETLENRSLSVKIRSTMAATPCVASVDEDGRIRVVFDSPQFAVCAGQTAVLYDGERVVGGGIIDEKLD